MGLWFRWQLVAVLLCLLSACQLPPTLESLFRSEPVIPRGGTVTMAFPDPMTAVQPWHVTSRSAEALVTVTQAGLMRLDAHGAPQLELLDRWQAAPDGLVITATVKPDLLWSDGEPLTSADVAFTYAALTSFAPTTPVLRELAVVAGVRAIDPLTVIFQLQRPYAPLLTLWALPILPMHVLGNQPIESLNLVSLVTGAGPFVYKERDATGAIHLIANPHYVRGAPYLDGIILVPDAARAPTLEGLQSGAIDVAELPAGEPVQQTQTLSVATIEQNAFIALVLNVRTDHLAADAQLRTVLRRATPISTTIDTAAIPELGVASGLVLDAHAYAVTQPVTNTADIQPMLTDAGWTWDADTQMFVKDTIPLVFHLGVDATNPLHLRVADAIAAQWRKRGLTVELLPLPREAYLRQFIPPFSYDIALVEWGNGRSDGQYADTYLYDGGTYPLYAKGMVNPGMPDVRPTVNLSGYMDDSYEGLIHKAQASYDPTMRGTYERDALTVALSSNAIIPIARRVHTTAWQSKIATPIGPLRLDTPWYLWGVEQWYIRPN